MVALKKETGITLLALLCIMLALVTLNRSANAQAPAQAPSAAKKTMRPGGPTVLDGGRVTFTLNAPEATKVMLNMQTEVGPSPAAKPVEMAKDAMGVWSVTLGPFKPDFYGYGFIVDGALIPDPANRNIWSGTSSAWSSVFVPGPEADFMAEASVPHGYWATLRYYSKVTKTHRQMQVYTPPGYGHSNQSYPVLYLSHGGGGNDTDWIACMRANYIMDNLIAQGKAKPMIVVMPDGNVGSIPQAGADDIYPEELLGSVIPAAEENFRIAPGPKNRAMAGLSLGGLWTLNTMLQRPGSFAYYGIFSSGWFDPLREDLLKNHSDRLTNPIINKETKLIWITCGGPEDVAYKNNLAMVEVFKKYKINHAFIQGTGGHVWDVWRKNLRDFAPLLFR
jgi:enterochelin esterase-like enzyme